MSDNIWVLDVQTRIYSKAKAMLNAKLKTKYPDLFVTDDDVALSDAKFPSIYINFLKPVERGQDLDATTVNAISLTVEVQTTVTKNQGIIVAREVAYEVLDVFKSMHFNSTMPEFENDNVGTKRMIARYTRVIGYDDKDTI